MSSSGLASSIANSTSEGSDSVIPEFPQQDEQEQTQVSPLTSQQQQQHLTKSLDTPPANDNPTLASSTTAAKSPAATTTTVAPPPAHAMTPLDTTTVSVNSPAPSAPVQAYAKLEGEDFCYYIRTLQVTLGRKAAACTSNNVDIPLGNTKSVSRHHARLFYNFSTQRFEMMVFGKNGALVNERFVECGATVPLENRTKIQIGDVAFVFLLPRLMELDDKVSNNGTSPDGTAMNGNSAKGDYISTPRQLEKNGADIITTTTLDHLSKKQRKRPLLQKKNQQQQQQQRASTAEDAEFADEVGGTTYSPTPGAYSDKNIKPPYSYAAIIAQAINSCPEKKMTLSSIYAYITHQYPYYQMTQNGWQNSIRHNLSLNKAFIKVPRQKDEPGKGAFWAIDPNVDPQFLNGIYKRNKRSSPQQQKAGDNNNDATPTAAPPPDDDLPCSPTDASKKRIKLEHGPPSSPTTTPAVKEEERPEPSVKMESTTTDMVSSSSPSPPPPLPPVTTATTTPTTTANTSDQNQIHTKKELSPPPAITTTTTTASIPPSSQPPAVDTVSIPPTPGMQTQLQVQLQQTIRQHLLDPVRNPLPPSIAQLLPQAIAQLPPALRTQLSATLQAALNAHQPQPSTTNMTNSTSLQPPPPPPSTESPPTNEKPSS